MTEEIPVLTASLQTIFGILRDDCATIDALSRDLQEVEDDRDCERLPQNCLRRMTAIISPTTNVAAVRIQLL